MNKKRFTMPLGVLLIAVVFSVVIMLLWNWLMPTIFGLTAINFWQALGMLILSRILLGNLRLKFHNGDEEMRCGLHGRNHLREKWTKMTPEERKEYIKKTHHHWHDERFGKHDFFDERDNE